MARRRDRKRRRRFDGGAEYVDDEAGDRPGRLRGPELLLVTLLGVLMLAMPVAWGIGVLATVGRVLGTGARIGLWLVWGVVVMVFGWSAWSIWRRAA